jgi:hypothetical protein
MHVTLASPQVPVTHQLPHQPVVFLTWPIWLIAINGNWPLVKLRPLLASPHLPACWLQQAALTARQYQSATDALGGSASNWFSPGPSVP